MSDDLKIYGGLSPMMKKAGYISIELVIVAGIVLVAGLVAVGSFVERGQAASNDAATKIDAVLSNATTNPGL